MRLDLDVAVRRCLKRIDQQLPLARSFEALELVGIDHHDRISAMQRYVLRAITVCKANHFTEACLSVLKAPTPQRRLRSVSCPAGRFSSHAD
jgi:hypothetical protein